MPGGDRAGRRGLAARLRVGRRFARRPCWGITLLFRPLDRHAIPYAGIIARFWSFFLSADTNASIPTRPEPKRMRPNIVRGPWLKEEAPGAGRFYWV